MEAAVLTGLSPDLIIADAIMITTTVSNSFVYSMYVPLKERDWQYKLSPFEKVKIKSIQVEECLKIPDEVIKKTNISNEKKRDIKYKATRQNRTQRKKL